MLESVEFSVLWNVSMAFFFVMVRLSSTKRFQMLAGTGDVAMNMVLQVTVHD